MRFIAYHPNKWEFEFNPIFNRKTRGFRKEGTGQGSDFEVPMDIIEGKEEFKILADLPGMERDQIKIMVNDGILTVSGKRRKNDSNGSKAIFSERLYGSISRSFKLPESIEKSGVSADYRNGLLEITLPKKEEARPKRIEVNIN